MWWTTYARISRNSDRIDDRDQALLRLGQVSLNGPTPGCVIRRRARGRFGGLRTDLLIKLVDVRGEMVQDRPQMR